MRAPLRPLVHVLATLTVLAVGAVPALGSPAAAEPTGQPTLTRYAASFTAELELRQRADYGSGNDVESEALVKVSGTIPTVRFAGAQLLGGYGKGRLATSGTASSSSVTDDGGDITTCAGSSVSPATSVPPILQTVMGRSVFFAFSSLSSLSSRVDCVNVNDPQRPTWAEVRELPAVPVPVTIRAAEIGSSTIRVPFVRTLPPESCPGYAGDHNEYCVYRLKGTLILRLVPDIGVFHKPTRARLAKAAAQASVVAGCGAVCTATLTVRPLGGAGSARTTSSLRPRDPKTLSVALGTLLRTSVIRSGGARLEVSYRSQGVTRTFKQKVRL